MVVYSLHNNSGGGRKGLMEGEKRGNEERVREERENWVDVRKEGGERGQRERHTRTEKHT